MVKLFLISIIESLGVENVWDNVLGKKASQTFGQECASAAIWMFVILLLRTLLFLLGLTSSVPNGLIFSFPFFIQMVAKIIPFMKESAPLVPVRVVECILGRVSSSHFLVVFPAHFLGCIVGIVVFQFFCPQSFIEVIQPVQYPHERLSLIALVLETLLVTCFCVLLVVAKELLVLNKCKETWLSVLMLPLYAFVPVEQSPTFNPAALYALWYVHMVGSGTSPDNFQKTSLIQIEHILGPVLGGILAGLVCLRFFPDDPSSWKPH
mmetsp:Transcript_2251/g.4199  ORF Transcript_2251/g.4199 Transcript_2251/m.4199 type:complete len:265 (+) Transcript_2251:15-809(+)